MNFARRQRDGGYLLLAVMLTMALMIIAATIAAPRVVQQMKRDREEEMIHRGTEYARAIKKFYKKNGRYPASLDDLDKGQVRFLRKRYKDPLTKDGKWKLLNYGDIATLLNTGAPGTPAASIGSVGGGNATQGSMFSNSGSGAGGFSQSPIQPLQPQQQQQGGLGGFPSNSDVGGTNSEGSSNNFGSNPAGGNQGFVSGSSTGAGTTSQPGSASSSSSSGSGSTFGSNSGTNQAFGGGAIVGVASLSKDPTIRIYNKKKTYNEWQFIYNPMMDQQNVLLRGPYQPTTIGSQNIGTPAGQMNQQNQQNQSPFGRSNSGFGQQSGIGTTSPQPTSSP